MSLLKVTVSVDDEHLDDFSAVVARSRKAGLKVEHQMETVGVISGAIDETKLKSLKQVKGVAQVEPEGTFQIAPPDSDIQ